MSIARAAKDRVRQNPQAYELVRRKRARAQKAAYVKLRDSYTARGGPVFEAPGGYLSRAELILGARKRDIDRTKSSLAEVRLFAALADDLGGPRLLGTLQRSCETVVFDLAKYRTPYESETTADLTWRPRLQRDLVAAFERAHEEEPLDLVLAYGSHLEFEPETLAALRSHGVFVALLCLDDKHRFDENPSYGFPNGQKPLIGSVDLHVTNSRECLRWYLAEGVAAYYMPQGIDTELFRPLNLPLDIDVSFMGQRYGFRGRFIEALRASGIDVTCFGPGWGTRTVSEDEKIEIYNRSRINLGLGGVAYSEEITCVKGRDFEVPAAGGFYLTTYDAELADLFAIGHEIACYRNEIDCAELIHYYLENEVERGAISRAGHERCLRQHTWNARVTELLEWIGTLRRGAPEGRKRSQPLM